MLAYLNDHLLTECGVEILVSILACVFTVTCLQPKSLTLIDLREQERNRGGLTK